MAAIPSEKVELSLGDGGTAEQFTAIAQLLAVTPPEKERASVDTTVRSDDVKTARASLQPEPGSASCRIQFDPAVHDDLLDLEATGAARNWKIEYLDASDATLATCTFNAFISRFGHPESGEDNNLEAELELKLTGLATWS